MCSSDLSVEDRPPAATGGGDLDLTGGGPPEGDIGECRMELSRGCFDGYLIPMNEIFINGKRFQDGVGSILSRHGIAHVFTGHPSMGGLFFAESKPKNFRDWVETDYTLYNAFAAELNDLGILCEPDSREPWFISAAHDDDCFD